MSNITDEKNNNLFYSIDEGMEGKKLRDYLKNKLGFSTRFLRTSSLLGNIKVNGKTQKLNYVLMQGDKISISLDKNESGNVIPEYMEIEVVYEDEDVLVINKPPGMVVHPTKSYQSGTLANGVQYYLNKNGTGSIVRLVSRLDMDTSGLILIAKNKFAHMSLARDMDTLGFKKNYIAISHGIMKRKTGTIDLPIYRPEDGSIKRIVDDRGQRSITNFEVLEEIHSDSVLNLTLQTGRTHQIRVHLSNIGHPIYGDTLYGIKEDEGYINRQALHAYKLSFPRPRDGKLIDLDIDLPKDMLNLIFKLKNE